MHGSSLSVRSEALLPHTLTFNFPEIVLLHQLELALAFSVDDSYTPEHIIMRAGLSELDLIVRAPSSFGMIAY